MLKSELISFGAMSKEERETWVAMFNTKDLTLIQQFWKKICRTCCTADELLENTKQFSYGRMSLQEYVPAIKNRFGYNSKPSTFDWDRSLKTINRVCYLTSSSDVWYKPDTTVCFKLIVLGDDELFYASTVSLSTWYIPMRNYSEYQLNAELTLTRFQKWNKFTANCFVLIKDLDGFMSKYNPYLKNWAVNNHVRLDWALQCPQLEQIVKMGYTNVMANLHNDPLITAEIISRLTKRNKKIGKAKKIWNSSNGSTNLLAKTVLSLLKDGFSVSLKEWDMLRKLMHTEKIFTEDEIRQVYELNLDNKDLVNFNCILAQKYQGQRIFSLSSLTKYLKRIDTYEAIDKSDGLMLLKDYLLCCKECKVMPRIDSDSLKREHDVMARNARLKVDPKADKEIHYATQYLRKYEYEEENFFIRPIISYADLLDEANQQRNSVACYRELIIGKHIKLFTMRSTHSPSESFVTVELSPDCSDIRAALMAANRKIHNKAVSEFLHRWLKRVQLIKRGEAVPKSPTPYYTNEWVENVEKNAS